MIGEIFQWCHRNGISEGQYMDLMRIILPEHLVRHTGGGKSETAVSNDCRIAASEKGNHLWRNNVGVLFNEEGTPVRYGLMNDSKRLNEKIKSSDLIGITRVTSTAPGQVFGVFTAVETKKAGWTKPQNERERAQEKFHTVVRMSGGIGFFAQDRSDYERMFK